MDWKVNSTRVLEHSHPEISKSNHFCPIDGWRFPSFLTNIYVSAT